MSKIYTLSLFAVIGFLALSGCARYDRIKVLEGDTDLPYEVLGTLEVQSNANLVPNPYRVGAEVLSLGYTKYPERGGEYKKILNRKLAEKADQRYHADAVINVEYWPDPSGNEFPGGIVRARGDMIKYKPFASGKASAAAAPPAA